MMEASEKIFKAIGIYSITLGAAVILMWIMLLRRETILEGDIEMAFHLVSEFLMASLCVGSGVGLFRGACLSGRANQSAAANPVNALRRAMLANLAGHSMGIYSVINAAGYYAERGIGIMVLLFLVLLVLSASILAIHISKSLTKVSASTSD